jgi:hypothetical protein
MNFISLDMTRNNVEAVPPSREMFYIEMASSEIIISERGKPAGSRGKPYMLSFWLYQQDSDYIPLPTSSCIHPTAIQDFFLRLL